jgi:hypothetical protein
VLMPGVSPRARYAACAGSVCEIFFYFFFM